MPQLYISSVSIVVFGLTYNREVEGLEYRLDLKIRSIIMTYYDHTTKWKSKRISYL